MSVVARGAAAPWALLAVVVALALAASAAAAAPRDAAGDGDALALGTLLLPAHFSVSVAARVPKARHLIVSPAGVVYVSTLDMSRNSTVYAVTNLDGRNGPDAQVEVLPLTSPLWVPNGIEFYRGDLYVAEVNRVWVLRNVEADLHHPPAPVALFDLPDLIWHGWRTLRIDTASDTLIVAVGAPCNVPCDEACDCLADPDHGTLQRWTLDGQRVAVMAHGVRNCVGMDFHPVTHDLWFTDNGRDNWDPDHSSRPPDELNMWQNDGQHFGFPFCYGYNEPDLNFNLNNSCAGYVPVKQGLVSHAAALGIRFMPTGPLNVTPGYLPFPSDYASRAFIAEHGSWDSAPPHGYRITTVAIDAQNNASDYRPFLDGFINNARPQMCVHDSDCVGYNGAQVGQCVQYSMPDGSLANYCTGWGRPVDIAFLIDGSMLFSDDLNGAIYRVRFTGTIGNVTAFWAGIGVFMGIALFIILFFCIRSCRERSRRRRFQRLSAQDENIQHTAHGTVTTVERS